MYHPRASQVATSCYWMRIGLWITWARNICRRSPNLRHPATPRRGGNTIWHDVTTWTNQRSRTGWSDQSEAWFEKHAPTGQRGKETQENCGLLSIYTLLSVYLLSSEPWMGLELPLSWHLSSSSRWSSWYHVTQNCQEKYKQIRSNNFTARATMKAVLFNKLCLGIIGRLKIYSSIILTPITDHCIHLLAPSGAQGVTIPVCLSVCHVYNLSRALNLCLSDLKNQIFS